MTTTNPVFPEKQLMIDFALLQACLCACSGSLSKHTNRGATGIYFLNKEEEKYAQVTSHYYSVTFEFITKNGEIWYDVVGIYYTTKGIALKSSLTEGNPLMMNEFAD